MLLVCGRVAPDLTEGLAGLQRDDRLVAHDRFVTEDELVMAAVASDVIVAMYDNHHLPSGIVALAAQVGRPVVVPVGGRLASIVEKGGGGMAAEMNVESLVAAFKTVRLHSEEMRRHAVETSTRLGVQEFVDVLTGSTSD